MYSPMAESRERKPALSWQKAPSTSWPHLILIISHRPHLLIPFQWGVNLLIWRGHKHSVHNNSVCYSHWITCGFSNTIWSCLSKWKYNTHFYLECLSLVCVDRQTPRLWYRAYVLFISGEVFHNFKLEFLLYQQLLLKTSLEPVSSLLMVMICALE